MTTRYGSRIEIDGSTLPDAARRRAYERMIHEELLQLAMFESGRAILAEFERSRRRRLRIVPYAGPHAAETAPARRWRHLRVWQDVTERGETVRTGAGRQVGSAPGRGTGSDPELQFTADRLDADGISYFPAAFDPVWVRDFLTRLPSDWPTSYVRNRGSTLLHELVHALRFQSGVWTAEPMGGGWSTAEEFLATMIANLLLSERGAPQAGEYARYARIANEDDLTVWTTTSPFREALGRFTRQMPDLALRLAAIDTPGNVFRIHLGAARAPARH